MTIEETTPKEQLFSYVQEPRTVHDILGYVKNDKLNLSPGFQRNSVWKENDRKKLIDSILKSYPLPAIFLYKRTDEKGNTVYDVIDGKQRLESIIQFYNNKYFVKKDNKKIYYRDLKKERTQGVIDDYKLNVIFVDGEFGDIIDLFIRINSTGKALTPDECNKAKYYQTEFLKAAHRLSKKFNKKFVENKIFSKTDFERMKDIGFLCDLMYAIHCNHVCDKKSARNNAFGGLVDNRSIDRIEKQTYKAIDKVFQVFPEIRTTRFKKISDFYCLVFFIYKCQTTKNLALDNKKSNQKAFNLLKDFSDGVAKVQEKERVSDGNRAMYMEYLDTVKNATDSLSQREKRYNFLDNLLSGIFEKKAKNRIFSEYQRQILWHSSEEKCCTVCGEPLTWENLTIDHKKAYSKGGATKLSNAALMCRSCNSRKGNR